MARFLLLLSLAVVAALMELAAAVPVPTPQGIIETTPYTDERWTDSPQKIPGRLWFAYADKGPEVRLDGWMMVVVSFDLRGLWGSRAGIGRRGID